MLRCLSVLISLLSVAAVPRGGESHVLVLTIDGFSASLLTDPAAPVPTFRALAAEGATAAQGMRVVNPSVTWPNHTSIVTGVRPDRHGVLANGVIRRGEPGRPARVNPDADMAELVAVPTVFDVLHKAGLSTAGINWPCTRGATTLDDNWGDVPRQVQTMTPRLRDELTAAGIIPPGEGFDKFSGARRDQAWTAALCHVIRARKPRFMLWHFLNTDSLHHKYGPSTPAGHTGLALADAHLRDVLKALDDAGIRQDTTIFILADHGFSVSKKLVLPNVLLRKGGLLRAGPSGILKANAHIISEGGIALLYLTDPATADADRAKAIELLKGQEGIADILTPDRFAEHGLPLPGDENPQAPNLVLSAADGYAFSNTAVGEASLVETSPVTGTIGHHGYLSTNPKMNAVFIAAGRGIRKGAKIGLVENVDIAPTAAHLLGHEMKDVDGKVLTEILETPAAK